MSFTELLLFIIAVFLFIIMKLEFAKWYKHWDEKFPDFEYWIFFIATLLISTFIICVIIWIFGKGFGLL